MTISLMIAGMPESGKTTFIAALRYCLADADLKNPALVLESFSADEKHLNMLEDRWVNCEKVGRTQQPSETWVEFTIRDRANDGRAILTFPDFRGELFEQPATLGQCNKSLLSAFEVMDGLLMFTNADQAQDDMLIDDVSAIVGEPGSPPLPTGEEYEFSPGDMAEEAKIVELLQAINRRPRKRTHRMIALIISGWDAVDQRTKPADWLALNRPMVQQFLHNNQDLWSYTVYGISAQGGKLDEDKERLLSIELPSDRIIIVGNEASQHDISAPVQWLLQSVT